MAKNSMFLILYCFFFLIPVCGYAQKVEIFAQTETKSVTRVAYSPSGRELASVSAWNTIKIWDIENGRLLHTTGEDIPHEYAKGNIKWFEYSPDGNYFFYCYDDEKGGLINTVNWEEHSVINGIYTVARKPVAFSYNNQLMAIIKYDEDYQPYISIVHYSDGREKLKIKLERQNYESITISPDDKYILVTSLVKIEVFLLETGDKYTEINAMASDVLYTPNGKQFFAGQKLYDAQRFREIMTLQMALASTGFAAFMPDGNRMVIANFGVIYKLSGDGFSFEKSLFTLNDQKNIGVSLSLSPDGKYIAFGQVNGSVCIKEISTGNELIRITSFEDNEWVMMTPDGFYNASPRGDEHLNIRIDFEAFPLNQFSGAYYHPNVVTARLKGLTDPDVVRHFGNILLSVPPPALMVELQNKSNAEATGIAELSVKVVDAFNKYPLNHIEIIVNGRLVGGAELSVAKGGQVTAQPTKLIANSGYENLLDFSIPIKLDEGYNYIEVVAANEACYGLGTLELTTTIKNQDKPDLWLLGIGINDYRNLPAERPDDEMGLIDLGGAVGDAKRIMETFSDQQEKRYKTVHSRLIADGERVTPTRANILANMDFLKQAKPEDIIILFIAAHGVTVNNEFYVLPSDTTFDKSGLHPDLSKTIDVKTILDAVDVPGRKLVIIDTCQSGGVDNNMLVRTLKNRSIVIFTAAQQSELAQERQEYGGGIFTYSFIEGLKGDAAKGKDILIDDLGAYVNDTVGQLSRFAGRGKTRQHPNIIVPDGFKNFVIAEIR